MNIKRCICKRNVIQLCDGIDQFYVFSGIDGQLETQIYNEQIELISL